MISTHQSVSAQDRQPDAEPLPVSVVIPAYNRQEMVVRAVRSALNQHPRPPAEVIVVDDCSSDGTGEAAAQAGARVITHDVNGGEGAARNTGFAHARCEWVGLLDSDDEWLPNLLATLWPVRDGHVMAGGGSLNCIDGELTCTYAGLLRRQPLVVTNPGSLIYPENFVAASGTLVKRDVVRAVGGYAAELRGGADMDLWIRVLERGTGIVVPTALVRYHLHEGQVTTDVDMMANAHRAVALRYSNRSWWDSGVLERWEGGATYDAAKRAWVARRPSEAAALLTRIVRSPNRLLGAATIVRRRLRLRRRSGFLDARNVPSMALLPGTRSEQLVTRDLSQLTTLRALRELMLNPTHRAVTASWGQSVVARLVGVREITRG